MLPTVREASAAAEILDPGQIAARFPPAWRSRPRPPSSNQRRARRIRWPLRGIRFHQALRHRGALAEAVACRRILAEDGRVRGVDTGIGAIASRRVVLATGPETPAILAEHGMPQPALWSQKVQVSLFEVGGRAHEWPGFVDDFARAERPARAGRGQLLPGPADRPADGADRCEPRSRPGARPPHPGCRRGPVRRPSASARPRGALCHADCYSTAGLGVIGPPEDAPTALCLATGFSGGGFKLAPYVAEQTLRLVA